MSIVNTSSIVHVLNDFQLFSEYILKMPLREYQLAPYKAVLASVIGNCGDEFLWIFPRQSGKNEALTHLLVYLLNLLQLQGGNIIFAAVGDGVVRGLQRLEERLDNPLNRDYFKTVRRPPGFSLGKARALFLSSHPQAHVRGETAHWLLVIDELQDQDRLYIEQAFTPMRAANNATFLGLGTTRTKQDALWLKKTQLEAMTARDDKPRVFLVPPEQVIKHNKAYADFLRAQVRLYGRNHPVVSSEYFLEPIDGKGGLFPRRRRRLMQGRHLRQLTPLAGRYYLATIDLAGQDEAPTQGIQELSYKARDSTVCYIWQLIQTSESRPTYHAVDVFVDVGSRHFAAPSHGQPLSTRLLHFLKLWDVQHVVVDESGVGEGITDWLSLKLPNRVTGYKFTRRGAKAHLGTSLLTVVETGRFKYWQAEVQPEDEEWYFWKQVHYCTYTIPPGGTMESDMRWGVNDGISIEGLNGRVLLHDDHLLSAALVAVYDDLFASGALRLGQARSVVIPPKDIFKEQ